jgi:hypothetical protein
MEKDGIVESMKNDVEEWIDAWKDLMNEDVTLRGIGAVALFGSSRVSH